VSLPFRFSLEVVQWAEIAYSLVPVLCCSSGAATLAVAVALAVGLGIDFGIGGWAGAKRSLVVVHDVATELFPRDRFFGVQRCATRTGL
jgi:hypothetical protein